MARHDRLVNALASPVGQLLVLELGREGVAGAHQMAVQPATSDLLQLAEEVQLGLFARVPPLGFEQPPGEFVDERVLAHLFQPSQSQVHALADDALVVGLSGTNQLWRELQDRVVVEFGGQLFLGELDAVALNAGEAYLAGVALGSDGPHLHRLHRRLGRRHHGLGGEVEGDAQHVGVLDVEEVVVVEVVGLPPQRPTHHLLAQQLGSEGANAQHVRDVVGVPALGEHRHRHHAPDAAAQPARLAHRVHHLAQDVGVGEVLGLPTVAGALDDLAPELLDLGGGGLAEAGVQGFAGFELLAVD